MSSPSPSRILSVEDKPETRLILKHQLQETYEVVFASDAEEALEVLDGEPFDLLLLDINLGDGKSGTELLHMVRGREDMVDIPAVALTAYAMPDDREYARKGVRRLRQQAVHYGGAYRGHRPSPLVSVEGTALRPSRTKCFDSRKIPPGEERARSIHSDGGGAEPPCIQRPNPIPASPGACWLGEKMRKRDGNQVPDNKDEKKQA